MSVCFSSEHFTYRDFPQASPLILQQTYLTLKSLSLGFSTVFDFLWVRNVYRLHGFQLSGCPCFGKL